MPPRGYVFKPLAQRFDEKVRVEANGCWQWTGFIDKAGYGRINSGGRGTILFAHRYSHERFKGPIPAKMDVDHLCRVRKCVNPGHLEAVSHSVNLRRAPSAVIFQTGRCGRGHDIAIHGYARKDRPGQFNCLQCRREYRAERKGFSAPSN